MWEDSHSQQLNPYNIEKSNIISLIFQPLTISHGRDYLVI